MKYRSKPVVIEAIQYNSADSFSQMKDVWGDAFVDEIMLVPNSTYFFIYTLEGRCTVRPGDWIIKGLLGDFYKCKDEIFKQKYEAINEK